MNNNFAGVVLSFNEELNIAKCLTNLRFLKKVYLIDSFSSDKTVFIAKKFSNVKIIKCKKNLDYVDKINFVKKILKSKWILILDADYELPFKTLRFLYKLNPTENISAYKFKIQNIENDVVLKADLFPKKSLLMQSNLITIEKNGHKEKIKILGRIYDTNLKVYHNDKKKFFFWIKNQVNYALKDAKLLEYSNTNLRIQDKIRRIPFLLNLISPLYYLFYKKLLIYGWPGFKYTLKRQPYEFFLSIFVIYFKIKKIFYKK